jgi:hypothetical protein
MGVIDDEQSGNPAAQCLADGIAHEVEQSGALTR